MERRLDIRTLNTAIRDYSGIFLLRTKWSESNPEVATNGRDWVIQSLYNMYYMDEHKYVVNGMKGYMGQDAWKEFEKATKHVFTPRRADVHEKILAEKLAIRPDGTRIEGKLGTVVVGERYKLNEDGRPLIVMKEIVRKNGEIIYIPRRVKLPIYAGDPEAQGVGAAYNMSAEAGIAMLDALDTTVNEGSTASNIRIVDGTQPADPDAALTGTVLATLTGSDPFFNAAVDDADGTVSMTAGAISDDTSADATGTASHFRVSATGTGADDHIDGDAGTSGTDMILNTTAISAGANVSITSYVVGLDQGTSAT